VIENVERERSNRYAVLSISFLRQLSKRFSGQGQTTSPKAWGLSRMLEGKIPLLRLIYALHRLLRISMSLAFR
jgi:hypothetical protein